MTNQNFRVKNGLQVGNITIDSGSGIITATKFVGDGSSLTNLPSGGGGGGTSDFVRTSAGIHTTSGVGIGTTSINSVLNVGNPGIADTTNSIATYGNFDIQVWSGIGTYSILHNDFTVDGVNNTYVVGGLYSSYYNNNVEYTYLETRPIKPIIVKINSSQELEWNILLESPFNPSYEKHSDICGICSATNGDIVVALKSYAIGSTSDTSLSFVKINSVGAIVWQTSIDNISHDEGYRRKNTQNTVGLRKVFIDIDSSGNIYACGGSSPIPYTVNPYIIKLNSSGEILYNKNLYNTTGPLEFAVRGSNLYVVGQVSSGPATYIRVVKLNLNADIVNDKWFNYYISGGDSESLTQFHIDENENLYFFTKSTDWGFAGRPGQGYIVEKYNSSFVRQWAKRINTTTSGSQGLNGCPNSISTDLSGNIYITAINSNFKSRHTFGYDLFKLNSSGDLIWKRFLSVPHAIQESAGIENGIEEALSSKVKIKNNIIKFVADVATPNISKDFLGDTNERPGSNNYSWIEKRNSDTTSFIVANLDDDGNSIGLYGGYSIEELIPIRTGEYVVPKSPTEVITNLEDTYYSLVSNVGIGTTVGPVGLGTTSLGVSTASPIGYFGGGGINSHNYPHFKLERKELINLNIEGTAKLSKLIVGNIEFGGNNNESLHTIAIGYSSGFHSHDEYSDRYSKYNTFIGAYAAPSTFYTSGTYEYNNFIGYRAGSYSHEGCHNNYIGAFAGYYVGGNNNNFFGSYAGYANSWGECNVFIGCRAGAWATGSNSSVMIGEGAGGFGGGYGAWASVFIGRYAGACSAYDLSYYSNNTFIGAAAGGYGGGGNCNTFVGAYAGSNTVDGSYNNFFGLESGCNNITGCYNNFFGNYSGVGNITGCNNIFFGTRSGGYNATGNYNVFLGANSGSSANSSFKTIIGSSDLTYDHFDTPDPEKDRQLAIGHKINGVNKYWILGDEYYNIGIGTTSINSRLHVTSNAFTNPGIGSETWILQYGDIGTNIDYQYFGAVSYDSLGNIYTCGRTDTWGYAFVIKTDPYGSIIWEKFFDHPDANKDIHSAEAIFVDKATDDVYVAIEVYDVVNSIILVKLDSSGNILWQREIDGTSTEYPTSISVSSGDYVFVLGSTNSEGQGDKDLLIVAFNKSGDQLWKKTIGGGNADEGFQISSTASYVFVAGNAYDPSNSQSAFLVYGFYNPNGSNISSRTYRFIGDNGSSYILNGIKIYEGGYSVDVVVTGYSSNYGYIINTYRDFLDGNISDVNACSIIPYSAEIYGLVADSSQSNIYITGTIDGNRIFVSSLNYSNFMFDWTKEVETSNGDYTLQYFGRGKNFIDLNSTEDKLVICGYREKFSTNETDGILLQLPINGLNVDGIYGTSDKFKIKNANYGRVPLVEYDNFSEDANVNFGIVVGVSSIGVSTSGIITSTSPPSYTPLLLNFIPDSLYNDAATFDGNVVINGGQLSFNNGASIGGNLGIGTTNPITKLQIGSVFNPQVLGFGTVTGYLYSSTNILIGDETTGSSLTPQEGGLWEGLNNVFIGAGAGAAATTANSNIFIGLNAGCSTINGYYNNFFGTYAGCSNTTGSGNNFMGGYLTGVNNTTGSDNNFFGVGAGSSNTTGSYNNFIGYEAGYCNTGGYNNNFIGQRAGYYNTTGSDNNFFGHNAGNCNTGGYNNNFIGVTAGHNNTTGNKNNFIGDGAGYNNTVGMENNFIGVQAGYGNTSGSFNNFIGSAAGRFNTIGRYNNFFGPAVGCNNTSGSCNNFLGYVAGRCNTTGSDNNFMGLYSGYHNTTGSSNNFIGKNSGCCNTNGCYNAFYGASSGRYNTTGTHNIFLGSYSGVSASVSHKVVIGAGLSYSYIFDAPNESKDIQFAIGVRTDANESKYWLVGDENFNVGIGTTNPTTKLHVGGDVKVGINTSQGIILTSPNGTAYRLVVDDSGNLTTTLV